MKSTTSGTSDPKDNGFRLSHFQELLYNTKKALVSGSGGRQVDSLLLSDLKRLDIVRILDQYKEVHLLEMVDPARKHVLMIHFPPFFYMKHWQSVCDWGEVCWSGNLVAVSEDLHFQNSHGNHSRIDKIFRIEIMEERFQRLPGY